MNNHSTPLISIIIPSYNNAGSLEKCIEHITATGNEVLEIIVVDGSSQDNSSQILKQFSDRIGRIQWISEPDEGIYDALNKGCRLAKGDYFFFLGADDLLTDTFINAARYLTDQHTIYYGDVILAKTGKTYDGPFSPFKMARTNISHQAIFYPKSVFDTYRFSLHYPIQADWELNMRLWKDADYRFEYINVPVAVFGEDGISSRKQDTSFNENYLLLIKDNFPLHIYYYRKMLSGMLSLLKKIIPTSLIDKLNKLPFQI